MLPLVTLTEGLNLDLKLQTSIIHNRYLLQDGFERISENPMIISRNASSDTFNLEIPNTFYFNGDLTWREYPYVNLNNKYEFVSASSISDQVKVYSKELASWKVHHTLLGDTPFREIKTIVMGSDYAFPREGTMRREVSIFDFDAIQKNVVSDFSHIVEIKTIKTIRFNFTKDDYTKILGDEGPDDRVFKKISNATFTWSHMFVKPIKVDRFNGNQDIAEIYGYSSEGDVLSNSDYDIKDASMKSSSLANEKLGVYFEKETDSSKHLVEDAKAIYMGKLKISDPTYYDYSSNSVKAGFASNSIIGETIPYSFKGDYTRELDITLNAAFKNMKLSFSDKLNNPVLNPFDGSVKLSLKSDEEPKQTRMKRLTPEDIKMIRARKVDLGLNGLINLDEHKIR